MWYLSSTCDIQSPFKIFCNHIHSLCCQDDLIIWRSMCHYRSRFIEQNKYCIAEDLQSAFAPPTNRIPVNNIFSLLQRLPQFNTQNKSLLFLMLLTQIWSYSHMDIFLPQTSVQFLCTNSPQSKCRVNSSCCFKCKWRKLHCSTDFMLFKSGTSGSFFVPSR